jgi:hypothetical protein
MSENATHEVGRVPSDSARLPRHRQPSVAEVERISAVMHRFTHAWNGLVFLLLFEDAVSFYLQRRVTSVLAAVGDRSVPLRESAATATHSHRCLGRFRRKDPSAVYATQTTSARAKWVNIVFTTSVRICSGNGGRATSVMSSAGATSSPMIVRNDRVGSHSPPRTAADRRVVRGLDSRYA